MAFATKPDKDSTASTIYYVYFEDYLKPKSVKKQTSLLFANQTTRKSQLRLRLLEHPVLVAGHKSKWSLLKEKLDKNVQMKFKNLNQSKTKIFTKFNVNSINLPRFFTFLHARNDVTTCKPKSGFEIYCEIASIHGFNNFVGATTWQRAFWFLVVLIAVIMSGSVLLLSHFMNVNTPTILYSESTQYPTTSMPFPAVTICNLNMISKRKAESLAQKFQVTTNLTINELTNYFKLSLSTTENISAGLDEYNKLGEILKTNNYTLIKLLENITPNCEDELLRCKFYGEFLECGNLFKKIETSFGQCCSFNYKALNKTSNALNDQVAYISNCGYNAGLSVLLEPNLKDYKASSTLTPGFRILIHDTHDFPDMATMQRIITPTTTNKIRVWPQQTYATDHISSLQIKTRKCYFAHERQLFNFGSYSQVNCLAECRSSIIYNKCQCSLPYRPKMYNWTMCDVQDMPCYVKYKSLMISDLKYPPANTNDEEFICDCHPLCDFHIYNIDMDSAGLTRKYSLTEKGLFKDINITNHILLQVFISELHAERTRLDVYENWLSFLGTFGGITGLHMGYSFLSGFELIFFVFVRPACNWLNRKHIEYRIKKRKKKEQQQGGAR